jgi:hypothetical protein
MSQIDRLLDEVWAETEAASPGASAQSGVGFALSVMEAVAVRRLRADLAVRFAMVIALLATGWAAAPVMLQLQQGAAAMFGAGALTAAALILVAALSIAAAARRWPAMVTHA